MMVFLDIWQTKEMFHKYNFMKFNGEKPSSKFALCLRKGHN